MRISDWSSDVCSSDLIGLWSLVARARRSLYDWPWLHKAAVLMGPSGFVAVIAGWVTKEVGRQPWTVYGLLRTADSVVPLDAHAVAVSLLVFVIVYFAVFGGGIWYILRMLAKPPEPHESATLACPVTPTVHTPAPQTGGTK